MQKGCLIDLEHRIASSILCQREHGLCSLSHLSRLGIARRDDAGAAGAKLGKGQRIARAAELGLCDLERSFGRAQNLLGLVVVLLCGEALLDQSLLALERRRGLAHQRPRRAYGSLGGNNVGALLGGIDARENRVRRDVVADLGVALGDATGDAEGQVGLHPRPTSPVRQDVGA